MNNTSDDHKFNVTQTTIGFIIEKQLNLFEKMREVINNMKDSPQKKIGDRLCNQFEKGLQSLNKMGETTKKSIIGSLLLQELERYYPYINFNEEEQFESVDWDEFEINERDRILDRLVAQSIITEKEKDFLRPEHFPELTELQRKYHSAMLDVLLLKYKICTI